MLNFALTVIALSPARISCFPTFNISSEVTSEAGFEPKTSINFLIPTASYRSASSLNVSQAESGEELFDFLAYFFSGRTCELTSLAQVGELDGEVLIDDAVSAAVSFYCYTMRSENFSSGHNPS